MRFEVFEKKQGPYVIVGVLRATDDDGNQWEKVFPSVQTAELLKQRFSTSATPDMSSWTPLKRRAAKPAPAPAPAPAKEPRSRRQAEPVQVKRTRMERAPVTRARPTSTKGWKVNVGSVREFTPGLASTYKLLALLDDIPEVDGDPADMTPWLFDLHVFVHGAHEPWDKQRPGLAPSLYNCVSYGYIDPDEIEPVKASKALASSSDSALSVYIRKRLEESPPAERDLSVSLYEPGRNSRDREVSLYYLVDNEPRTVLKLLAQVLQRELDELRDVVLKGRTRVDSPKRQPLPEDHREALLEVLDDIGDVSVHADELPIVEKRLSSKGWLSSSSGKTAEDENFDDDDDDAYDDE